MRRSWWHLLGFVFLIVLFAAATGSAETYEIDAAHSNVLFSIRHIFSQVQGGFSEFSGTVVYDPKTPEESSVRAKISTTGINTGNERRDNHLRSPDFFDAAQYPEITFESSKVEMHGDKLLVKGDLTVHGVTRSIVLPVQVLGVGMHPMAKAPVAGFLAEAIVKRSDFGVNNWTDKANILGEEVKILLNIEALAKKQSPDQPASE